MDSINFNTVLYCLEYTFKTARALHEKSSYFFVFAVIALFPVFAKAEDSVVYKCRSREMIIYQSMPCSGGKKIQLMPAPNPKDTAAALARLQRWEREFREKEKLAVQSDMKQALAKINRRLNVIEMQLFYRDKLLWQHRCHKVGSYFYFMLQQARKFY